jgi:high affinity sulfate transporter 1
MIDSRGLQQGVKMTPDIQEQMPGIIGRHLPITVWLPKYQRGWLGGDLVAGITIWALLVPEALAYAQIAGVPVQYGLYAAPFALIAYAVFGGSRRLAVGPTSTVAIVSASVVAPLAAAGTQRYLSLTIALALMVGLVLVVAGLMRLGFVAKFLAKPVLEGFIIGLAFTIALGQAGKLVGISTSGDTALQKLVSLLRGIGQWQLLPFLVGGGCLLILFLLSKYVPRLPAAIIALAVTTLLAYGLKLGGHGLGLVGSVPGGFPGWQLAVVGLEDLYHLLPGALAVALVGFAESIAIAKSDASRHDYQIDSNQEMIANGMSNIGAGLFQGFSVNGSLSKTAASEAAGGRTQLASIACAGLTLLTMAFLTGLFKYLPEATLGAIVIHALWHYFNPGRLARYYRVRKVDFLLSLAALLGVVLLGVLPGIIAGVILSLALLLNRVGSPHMSVLGREPGGNRFADLQNHPDYEGIPGLLIFRFDAALVFPNAELFATRLRRFVADAEPPVKTVIIDCEVMSDMDTTASDQLIELLSTLERQGVAVLLARVHEPVRLFMSKDGLIDKIGGDNIFPRVKDAVQAFENRNARPSRGD